MLTPFDLIKGFLSFKSYFTWFLIATTIFSLFVFFKRKLSPTQQSTTSWKGYLTYFLIIIGILSFIYLCFFHKTEPSSKYAGQLVNKIDKAIDKYENTINNYKGLKTNWESELKKCEDELKELYNAQESSQKQKEQIHELLEQNETKIKEIKEQLKNTTGNITILKGKLTQLEKDKDAKEKEIKQKQEEEKLASPDDKIRLRAQIEKLQDEEQKIIEEISEVKLQIKNLESNQKYYQDMLSGAENYKRILEERLKDLTEGEKRLYNQIQSVEERHAEIQKEIDAVKKKLDKIDLEKDLYESLKRKYSEMYNRMQTYEKEHEASAGNIAKWCFKAFDKVTDLIPAKYGIKTLNKTVSVTRKYAQKMGAVTLTLHEGHRLWHLYNEVAQENKEHPPMITKEALDMYTQDINRDLAKLDADYKDYEKKLADYKLRQNENNLEQELEYSRSIVRGIAQKEQSVIDEYKTIIKELKDKQKDIKDIYKLEIKQDRLEEELETKKEDVNDLKEQLKQKDHNYARAQQRLQARRVGKIPEMVMIPNKK
ncbi:DNA double-strand break repair Rad50 ATPase [Candidatus Phytoplasma luffae]|uniref:DNA double-strand break repair Rad50 ATPase n=1 Tax=Loofah witches'-broom phytoplasma TaxID=35773 RepID=A0A975FJL4_LOWBP|nr:DNA double-strand break repair protein Rad50 [Candidatus Phytoplasma luffae]QTX02927.1 DNA double-strand break repair Rad50 ATPase [Candidatus Phytoplasma luffae]QTX02974.1 DNA double-strand break repair Rad50 ATPase [Candidatus Phytoplasma luffae]